MVLIHCIPREAEPDLDAWHHQLQRLPSPRRILVGLPVLCLEWLKEAALPGPSPARHALIEWLGLASSSHEAGILERWFQAVDWLEQTPPDFLEKLRIWVSQQRAQQLARLLNLPYLAPDQAGTEVAEAVWADCDAEGKPILEGMARTLRPQLCQFWLPDPAFFTARPGLIPQARLLLQMESMCAQELARLRGHELNPESLDCLRLLEIEAQIGWLAQPQWPLSRVLPHWNCPSSVLAVSASSQIQLLTLASQRMWGRPGFLAEAFEKLAHLGASVDLLATSQTSVTLTLDPGQKLTEEDCRQLAESLSCQVQTQDDCTCIHWIGHKIRQILPQLGPALELFEEHPIHLVSQASSDISISLVVDSDQAQRLLTPLHALLFGGGQESEVFGPTFQQLESRQNRSSPSAELSPQWWLEERSRLLAIAEKGPAYVYHQPSLELRAQEVLGLGAIAQALYALKANPHPDILQCLVDLGFGLECVSPGELSRARQAGGVKLFTPNFVAAHEFQAAFEDCHVTLDNLQPLEDWPEVFQGRSIFLRLDSGAGSGHHKHVRTAGDSSKFGISPEHWPRLRGLLKQHRVQVLGLHCHAGSGITDAEHWVRTAEFLYRAAEEHFPQAQILNLGGGLGIPDRPGKQRLDFDRLQQSLDAFLALHPGRQLWLEPGRYLVAEAGVLLARITQIKSKGDKRYLGVDIGMNSLIRPALYGAYHPIVNLSRLHQPAAWKVDVVGPICESGDVLGHDRWLPASQVGDVLLIDNAGAYGASMASAYNLRPQASEVWLTRGNGA